MDLNINIILNAYSSFILVVLLFHSYKQSDRKSPQFRLFLSMVIMTLITLGFDSIARLDGHPETLFPILNQVGNFSIFLVAPILPSIWVLYVHDEIFHNLDSTMKLVPMLLFVSIINAIVLITSQFTHWYYYIDALNVYHRGPFYFVSALFTILLMLVAFIMIILNKKKIDVKHYNALILFAVPPFVSILLSLVFYGISLMLNSIVLSLLIIELYIQNQDLNTDYLTKVNNRKRLDQYITEKIRISTKGRTFAIIMIDLENFKSINDHFGHDVGDHVLKEAAQLLKSCLRSQDFIGRYGGDEFYVVLDVSLRHELMTVVNRINNKLIDYNNEKKLPYDLVMSMGYDIYDPSSKMTLEAFQKHIDQLMYQDKEIHRSKNSNPSSGR